MRKNLSAAALLLLTVMLFGLAPVALGDGVPTVFQGFEGPGVPSGWTLSPNGDFGVSEAVAGIAPTQGSQFAFIDNCGQSLVGGACASTAFTGVAGAINGTWIYSPTFSLVAGQSISMDLNFLSNEYENIQDFAYVELLGTNQDILFSAAKSAPVSGDLNVINTLGSRFPQVSPCVSLSTSSAFLDGVQTGPLNGVTYGPTTGPFNTITGATGWITSTCTPGAGTYELLFVVSNGDDHSVPSALAFDNITFSAAQGVPEPSELSLLGMGFLTLLGIGIASKKFVI